jgi:hypothetical protein
MGPAGPRRRPARVHAEFHTRGEAGPGGHLPAESRGAATTTRLAARRGLMRIRGHRLGGRHRAPAPPARPPGRGSVEPAAHRDPRRRRRAGGEPGGPASRLRQGDPPDRLDPAHPDRSARGGGGVDPDRAGVRLAARGRSVDLAVGRAGRPHRPAHTRPHRADSDRLVQPASGHACAAGQAGPGRPADQDERADVRRGGPSGRRECRTWAQWTARRPGGRGRPPAVDPRRPAHHPAAAASAGRSAHCSGHHATRGRHRPT